MSDELKEKETEKCECKCFCMSKGFRKFLTIALGTFVGVYCALSLFAALHRPPMMPPAFGPGFRNGCPCKMIHHHFRGQRPDWGNAQRPNNFQPGPAPFEAQRPQPRK